jgi:hypothetical protein
MKTICYVGSFLVITLSLIAAFPLSAESYENWGAIAYSDSTGRSGTSYNYPSVGAAERRALDGCGEVDCKTVLTIANACGALAIADNGSWGTGLAQSRDQAERYALHHCRSRGGGCTIKCWACTSR